jgi:hypothetical protein
LIRADSAAICDECAAAAAQALSAATADTPQVWLAPRVSGPVPDPAAADAIAHAVMTALASTDSEQVIAVVENGESLLAKVEERRLAREAGGLDTRIHVLRTRFFDADSAVVRFAEMHADSTPIATHEARMTRVAGKWLVQRDSFTRLMRITT